jgi:hypothetical protein
MGMSLGITAVAAKRAPIRLPADKILGQGIVLEGAIISQEAEADAVELVGDVDGGAPQAEAALLGLDERQAKGRVMGGDERGRPGQRVAVEGIATPRDEGGARSRVAVAGEVLDGIEADKGPHLASMLEAVGDRPVILA